MDFSQFDSRGAADEGRPLHIKHPGTGELMANEDGSPCIVHVLGIEGRIAQAAAKDAAKLPKLSDDATVEDYHERLCQTAERLVTGFAGVSRGDKAATKADVRWFLDLQMANPLERGYGRSFVEQVLQFSGTRASYLGKFEAASSEPPSKSAGKALGRTVGKKRAAKI